MTMRINTLVTHLRAEEAIVLIEFLDQLREVLVRTYGDDVKVMLQDASQRASQLELREEDEEPF
jgi:hypothetical protein